MAASGSVPAGTRVGRYEIESLIREGGMGEVYAAHDANLGRRVALKILPRHRTSDPDRVARFVREARASSALNHPSIVAVHDAGNEGDVHFLAMELIDGMPLSEWKRKRRSVAARVELMAQVAEGLARAHDAGIVHRDLKPDNIMVTRDGRAKIVDFGVAKLTERVGERAALSGVTTPTSRVGTTAYMAPEQVEGKPLDHRADVFAFGVVLYELLAGANPFAAPQYADTIHNVVHLAPPLDAVPHALRRIVRRCLQKEPALRYDSLRDAALDLRESVTELDAPPPQRFRWRALAALAAAVLVAATGVVVWKKLSRQSDAPAMTMTRLTNSGRVTTAAISPDGKYLVHAVAEGEQQALYVKQIATGTTTRIAEPGPRNYFNLRVSTDGNYAYYVAAEHAEPNVANLYQVPLLGGPPRLIAADTEFWYSLSPDGTQVAFRRFNAFEREHKLTIAAVDGSGEEVLLRRKDPDAVDRPAWTPDGESITFAARRPDDEDGTGLFRMSLKSRDIVKVATPKFPGVGSYAWLPDGSGMLLTVYDREQPPQVWYLATNDLTARKVTSEVSAYYHVVPTADARSFSAVREQVDSNIYTVDLAPPYTQRALTSGVGNLVGGAGVEWLNEREVIFTGREGGLNTFFVVGTNGGTPRRLIHNMPVWQPAVSPDGTRIAFTTDRSGSHQIWVADASGANPRQITHGRRAASPSFTPDGKSVVYLGEDSTSAWIAPIDGSSAPVQLTNVPTSRAAVSPDGKWLLCRLRSKEPNVPLWRTAVVPIGGGAPRYFDAPRKGGPPMLQWHPDGRSFLFVDLVGGVANLWRQDLDGSAPQQQTFFDSGEIYSYDVSRDGMRLAVARGHSQRDAVLIRDFR